MQRSGLGTIFIISVIVGIRGNH